MNAAGWLDGYQPSGLPGPRSLPPPPPIGGTSKSEPPAWNRGKTRLMVEVMCCPKCGSTLVKIRTSRPGAELVHVVCTVCGNTWRDRRGLIAR